MTGNGLLRKSSQKSRFGNWPSADNVETALQPQVAREKSVMTIQMPPRPSARTTPKFHSIGFHLWSK
jgi:hypothetical protein